jgi:hypothetical protein
VEFGILVASFFGITRLNCNLFSTGAVNTMDRCAVCRTVALYWPLWPTQGMASRSGVPMWEYLLDDGHQWPLRAVKKN